MERICNMENLIFSLNATVPVFLMMLLGLLFRKLGWISEAFAAGMNKFVFLVPLPVLLFNDLATVDFSQIWDLRFAVFCFAVTAASIGISTALSFLLRNTSLRGEFIQASYRSSAALLGIALTQNIYGNAGMVPLMIVSSVPLYNIMAVVVLSVFRPGYKEAAPNHKALAAQTLKGIVTNPILIGIAAGLLWSLLRLPMPSILGKTVSNIGSLATPMGLMAMGASFDLSKAKGQAGPSAAASIMKLAGFCVLFLPLAVGLGFRQEQLVAILIMLGSATTVSCYVMARNMGHEGTLTSSTVMLTTLFSAFTITGWLFLLKSFGFL